MGNNVGKITRLNPAAQVRKSETTDISTPTESTNVERKVNNPVVRQADPKSITGGVYEPVLITEVCHLPSKGLLYGNTLGETVEFRAMTTIEERMRLSGENFWSTMSAILNRCKVNTDFDMTNLVDFDFFATLVKLRIISYGNNYKTYSRCLSCGLEQEVNVNLDDVLVSELPDDFIEPFEIGPLPISKDVLTCRFLRVFDYIDIYNKVSAWHKKHPDDKLNDPEYTLLMEHAIVTINGAELNEIQKANYVANMIGADSSYYHDSLSKMFYGLHRIGSTKCKECGKPVIYEIAPSESFFRATPLSD